MLFTKKSRHFFHKNSGDFSIVFYAKKINSISTMFFFISEKVMNQLLLLTPSSLRKRTITEDNIKATFEKNEDDSYDIVLEINSNKFLIHMKNSWNIIEQLEILAIKWFIEFSNKLVLTIKRLIEYLRYRLD